MSMEPYDKEIVGDLRRAYLLLREVSASHGRKHGGDALDDLSGDREELLQGIGTIICVYMGLFAPGELLPIREDKDEPGPPSDALHMVVPAIVSKLTETLPGAREAIPGVAGALTCAALGDNCYEWRRALGPWTTGDMLAWTFAAWYLADLIDFSLVDSGMGRRGFALDFIADIAGVSPAGSRKTRRTTAARHR